MGNNETSSRRLRIALAAGRALGGLSRRLGRGSGVVMQGKLALALDPGAIAKLAAGRRSVIVTGTNGKSTTTRLVCAALGGDVASNVTGANMGPGVLTALSESDSHLVALEVDELHVPKVMQQTQPEVVVLLNATRDQLDRTLEVSKTSQTWSAAFAAHPGVKVVANVADPHVVDAAMAGDPVWVDPGGPRWIEDASVCPRCGKLLTWDTDGRWSCVCGFAMPTPDFSLTDAGARRADGTVVPFELSLPGDVNRGNAVFALAVADTMGFDIVQAAQCFSEVREVAGRYATATLAGRQAPLLLAKNPAGWAAALTMIPEDAVVIVGINARVADGTDTSWLWDVPFERLAGRTVGVIGERREDAAVRLHYAGATVVVDENPVALAGKLPAGELVVAANYTAFWDLRRYIDQATDDPAAAPQPTQHLSAAVDAAAQADQVAPATPLAATGAADGSRPAAAAGHRAAKNDSSAATTKNTADQPVSQSCEHSPTRPPNQAPHQPPGPAGTDEGRAS